MKFRRLLAKPFIVLMAACFATAAVLLGLDEEVAEYLEYKAEEAGFYE